MAVIVKKVLMPVDRIEFIHLSVKLIYASNKNHIDQFCMNFCKLFKTVEIQDDESISSFFLLI